MRDKRGCDSPRFRYFSVRHWFIAVAVTALLAGLGGASQAVANDGDGGVAGSSSPGAQNLDLSQFTKFTVSGSYDAAGVGLRGQTSGNITIAGIPPASTVTAAYLYWGFLDNGESPSLQNLTFQGTPITGTKTGTNEDTCWGRTNSHGYRADVTSLVPGNGTYSITGVASGGAILAQGASLVVIYTNPLELTRDIVLYDGNDVVNAFGETITNTLGGFTAAAPVSAKTTFIVGDGQTFTEQVRFTGSQGTLNFDNSLQGSDGPLWDTDSHDVSSVIAGGDTSATAFIGIPSPFNDCLMWVAQVLSVTTTPPEADLQKLEMRISGPSEIPVSEQVFYDVDEVLVNNGPAPRVDVRDIKKLDCPHPDDPPELKERGSEAAFPTQCSWVFDPLVEEIEVMEGVQYYLKRDIDRNGKCDPPKRPWFVGAQDHQQIPRSQLPPPPPDDRNPGPVQDGDCIVADSTPGVFKEIGVKKQVVLVRGEPVAIHEEFDVHCLGPSFHTFTLQDRIEAKDPAIRDPNPENNALERRLRVACIAQADLAITGWEVPAQLRARVSERVFFTTRKTLHNFGPFGPVDADVWKTMVIPPDAEGSVHVTPDEAPATIVIERPDGTREVRENQPASTTVFVKGPAQLSIHFKVRGLEVSVDRVVTEDFDVHCLRADRFLFTLTNEVMPQDPHVRDPNEANNRAVRTLLLECPVLEGRMTGGGSVIDPVVGRVTHGFELHCDATEPPNNLEVNWGGNRFHLETLTSAFCLDDPSIDPGQPAAPFDTYEGTGTGRCNGEPASIKWEFTDAGEPGVNDRAEISISGACTLTVSGTLERGNHQAHPDS